MNKSKHAVILYRKGVNDDDSELQSAQNRFEVSHLRNAIPPNSIVIGRYSVLPFYKELELDLAQNGSRLINSFAQHQFLADMREWYPVLEGLTPKLYRRLQDLPEVGPFVLKGQTNSKKANWATHMFAATKRDAGDVWSRLADDTLIAQQEILARDYVPLKRLMTGFNGLPITKEFRFFVLFDRVLCGAFYWSNYVADLDTVPQVDEVPKSFLREVINRIGSRANFYALDVAQTESGEWIVVELNDGQMSGLSCNDSQTFYGEIERALDSQKTIS